MTNINFVLNLINRCSKTILPLAAFLAVIAALVPFAGIFLPMIVLDLLISDAQVTQIIITIGGYTLLLVVLNFLNGLADRTWRWYGNAVSIGTGIDLIDKQLECEYSYIENPDNQALLARLNSGVSVSWKTISSLIKLVTGVLGFGLFALVLSGLNLWVVLLLTTTATANYFVSRLANRYEHKNKDNWAPIEKKIAYILRVTGDYEYGKDMRLYNMRPWFVNIASNLFSDRSKWDNKVQTRHFASKAVNALTVLFRDGIAYAFLIYTVVQGSVGIADFILYFGAIAGFSVFVTSIIDSISEIGSALPYVADLRKFMAGGTVKDPDRPLVFAKRPPEIEFKNVSFSYTQEQKILDDVSFTIKSGEKIALVGVNGSGKTTIIKLLCGFYKPDDGEVLLNGESLSKYKNSDVMDLFSAVFQEEFIMPLSLAENITVDFNDKKGIEKSLNRAGIWENVKNLPNGMKSRMTKKVREDGVVFSGGQNQKFFLARALYKDAPVLILDEPTAALDPIAESEVYQQYNEISRGKSSVFISHRLASTRFCDKILLIENGKIIETGTHDELINRGGEYARMYEIQSHYYND